jgi:DNA-binding NarL/FixJ family response regulator
VTDAGRTSGEPIRVVVADDHALFRRGLTIVLEAEGDIAVVAQAEDGEAAVATVAELAPDVVLMDVRMPRLDGIAATRRIRDAFPSCRIIVLTVSDDDDDLVDAVKAGANGYLLKEVSIEEVADAVRAVMAGHSLVSPALAAALLSEFDAPPPAGQDDDAGPATSLTDQERETLRQVAVGRTDAQIAAALSVTEPTVRNHVANIVAKVQFRSRLRSAMARRR